MAKKPKLWDDLQRSQDNFAQCPYRLLLDANLPDKALRLYLLRWHDAFTHGKRHKGMHCSTLSQKEIAQTLNCTVRYVQQLERYLRKYGYLYVEKASKANVYYFTRKPEWR